MIWSEARSRTRAACESGRRRSVRKWVYPSAGTDAGQARSLLSVGWVWVGVGGWVAAWPGPRPGERGLVGGWRTVLDRPKRGMAEEGQGGMNEGVGSGWLECPGRDRKKEEGRRKREEGRKEQTND